MVDKVGGVEFSVTIDSNGAVSAGSKIILNNEKIENSFQDVDLAARNSSRTLVKGSKDASKALGGMGRKAGMAGVQVQQLVGQIQGGQNVFGALSAQAADLGIVLGAPLLGSIAGLSAAFAGVLLPSLFNSDSAMDKLSDTSDKLNESLRTTDTGALKLGEGIAKLAKKSEALARIKIAASIRDAESQIKTSTDGIASAVQDFTKVSLKGFNDDLFNMGVTFEGLAAGSEEARNSIGNTIGGLRKLSDIETTLSSLQRRFDLTREQAVLLASSISEFQNNKGPIGAKRLQSALESLGDQTQNGNEKLNKFTASLIPFFIASADGVDATNLFRMALGDLASALDDTSDKASGLSKVDEFAKSMSEQLAIAKTRLNEGNLEAALLAASFKLGYENASQLPPAIRESITAMQALSDKQKEIQEQGGIVANVERIKASMATEAELRDQKFASDIEAIRAFGAASESAKAEADALELARVKSHADALIAIEQNTANQRADTEEKHTKVVESFRNAALKNAANLLDMFAGESRAAAIASIAINKGLALAQNTQNTLVAQTRALSDLGPWAGPPMAAKIGTYGAINAGLIAATGLAQAASLGSGGGTFSGGLPATNVTTGASAQGGIQQNNQDISISVTGGDDAGRSILNLVNMTIANGGKIGGG